MKVWLIDLIRESCWSDFLADFCSCSGSHIKRVHQIITKARGRRGKHPEYPNYSQALLFILNCLYVKDGCSYHSSCDGKQDYVPPFLLTFLSPSQTVAAGDYYWSLLVERVVFLPTVDSACWWEIFRSVFLSNTAGVNILRYTFLRNSHQISCCCELMLFKLYYVYHPWPHSVITIGDQSVQIWFVLSHLI